MEENEINLEDGRVVKTPVAYYGGKQRMIPHIIPLIPKHKIYVEGFFGGGAVFFAKPPSDVEVINDINDNVINFYRIVKNNYEELKKEIEATLHARSIHKETAKIYKNPEQYNDIKRAWAFWVQSNCSFGHIPLGGWAFSKQGQAQNTINKVDDFTAKYSKRLRNCHIECSDILYLIKLWDSVDTFFYLDPPYVSSDCGSYKGYTTEMFTQLLETASKIQGKFLMSSYPEKVLMEYRDKFSWRFEDISKILAVDGTRKDQKMKLECLTYNYELPKDNQLILF